MHLCDCISIRQWDEYDSLIRAGMELKNIGAALELWEELSKTSKMYKRNACSTIWNECKANNYTIATLKYLARKKWYGEIQQVPTGSTCIDWYIWWLYTLSSDWDWYAMFYHKKRGGIREQHEGHKVFRTALEQFLKSKTKTSEWKNQYKSGQTAFMQLLRHTHNRARVLLVTYKHWHVIDWGTSAYWAWMTICMHTTFQTSGARRRWLYKLKTDEGGTNKRCYAWSRIYIILWLDRASWERDARRLTTIWSM